MKKRNFYVKCTLDVKNWNSSVVKVIIKVKLTTLIVFCLEVQIFFCI